MMMGPNVRRLIVHKMSQDIVPDSGGFLDAVKVLSTPGALGNHARTATEWVKTVLALVRTAPDNPYQTDEEIAGEILRRIEEKRRGSGSSPST